MPPRPALRRIAAAWLTVAPLLLLAGVVAARAAEIELTVRKAVRHLKKHFAGSIDSRRLVEAAK